MAAPPAVLEMWRVADGLAAATGAALSTGTTLTGRAAWSRGAMDVAAETRTNGRE